jgi:hypothetical protein
MGAMGGGKGVVDENVAEAREEPRKERIVVLLARMKAGVFQKQDLAGLGCRSRPRRAIVTPIGRDEPNRQAQRLGQDRRDRTQRHGRLGTALRPSEMAEQDDSGTALDDLAQRRHDALDAGCIAHFAVLHGHVEIDAHDGAPAAKIDIVDGANAGRLSLHRNCFFTAFTIASAVMLNSL